MDRRSVRSVTDKSAEVMTPAAFPRQEGTDLSPYDGPWTFEEAAHLLKRASFGPTMEAIETAVADGLSATIEKLFQEKPLPEPPVNYFFENDQYVPIGETWIDALYDPQISLQGHRFRSLFGWSFGLILNEDVSIREKLTVFWLNHFSIANVNDPKFYYRHVTTLRTNAWGNFRDLVKAITIDPAMLRFLNGRQNTFQAPNENYARELLELYTIGKGPLAGPGDYTNYTEEDVKEIARALTGWRDTGYKTTREQITVDAVYRNNRHDRTEKQLSARFDNEIIPNMGADEYAHVIDIIFKKDEVARFISRKLYRWFVYYEISDEIEANVIQPMAQILIENDYNIKPALIALLSSQHFFDSALRGAMIKNPIDFTISTVKQLGFEYSENLRQKYSFWYVLYIQASGQQMQYLNPPDVAGWKAFYQEPLYYRTWINATTLPLRMALSDALTTTGTRVAGYRLTFYPLQWIQKLDNATDPNELIKGIAKLIFPMSITDDQVTALKEIIIPGLPDFEWTVEYVDYLENPGDQELAAAIDTKLRLLFKAMFSMSEFNLI